jgi:hypothetical protein
VLSLSLLTIDVFTIAWLFDRGIRAALRHKEEAVKQLDLAMREAQKANKAKSSFMAFVCHYLHLLNSPNLFNSTPAH